MIRSSRRTPSLCSGSGVSCLPWQRAALLGTYYARLDKPQAGQFFGHTPASGLRRPLCARLAGRQEEEWTCPIAGRTLQFGMVALVAGVALAATAAAQTAVACHMKCTIPNYGACADVTQCQNAQRACIDGCMMSLGLPQGGSAQQPAGGYGADALWRRGDAGARQELGHPRGGGIRGGPELPAGRASGLQGDLQLSQQVRCPCLEQGRSDDPARLVVCRRSAGGLGGQGRCAFRMREGRFQGFEFIPIKPSAATGSGAPGSYAGHNRVPSRDRGRRPSTGGSGL